MKKMAILFLLLSVIVLFAACGEDDIPTGPSQTPSLTVPTAPSDPAPTTPTQPVPSDPTEPAPSDPTEPAPSDPTEPAPSDPTEPAPTDPTQPEHTHVWVDATCTAPKTCSECGATEGAALGHSYELTGTEDATCTAQGSKTYTCSACADTYSEATAMAEHDYADATCTAPKTCKACGATIGAAAGHNYKLTGTKDATCTAQGSKTYSCSVCADTYSEATAMADHDYADATCTAPKTCKACGKTTGTALGHDQKLSATYEASCIEDGARMYTCTRCGYTSGEPISATGHSFTKATCQNPKTCMACGLVEGSVLDHEFVVVEMQEATCYAEGIKISVCNGCDETMTETFAKYDHTYSDATCTMPATCAFCGKTAGTALGHDHQVLEVQEATCLGQGYKFYGCTRCADSYYETLPMTDHNYADATCARPKTCVFCGKTVGEALGHHYEIIESQDPTCAAEGYILEVCTNCGHHYNTTIPVTDHDYADATCRAPKTCKTCGKTVGDALAHTWSDATCASPKTCKVCGTAQGNALGHQWSGADCSTLAVCARCGETSSTYGDHVWNDNNVCSVCGLWSCEATGGHTWGDGKTCQICGTAQCAVWGHYYFYDRCYYCGGYSDEVVAMARAVFDSIVAGCNGEYETVKAIHDYLVNNTQYDYDNYLNGTIPDSSYSARGVFENGMAVCQGYAYAFELLCDLAEIDCVLVTGTANGGGHAWNQVNVDGNWYNIDVTWDDPIYYFNGVLTPYLRYDYFLISDSVMYQDHVADDAQYVCQNSYPFP